MKKIILYASLIGLGVALTLLFPAKIKEVRNEEDIKTIKTLTAKINTISLENSSLKSSLKEHCVTTIETNGRKTIDCKRERETEHNAQTQSSTQGTVANNTASQSTIRTEEITKPANTIGIGPTIVIGPRTQLVGGMMSGKIWRLEPVLSVMYNTKSPELVGQLGILIH